MSEKMKILNQSIGKAGQSLTAISLVALGPHKLKTTIRSDSHPGQCAAGVELHDGVQWRFLASIPASGMATPHSLVYARVVPEMDGFELDRGELIRLATLILF